MAKASFGASYSTALGKLGLADKVRPDEIFPRFEKKSFDDLKKQYVDQYGYTIRIPKLEDIIHWKPREMKTKEEIKAEKRAGLMNILASPAAQWFRDYYSTPMTWMDNIQDAGSIVYPAVSMLARWAPKVFGRLVPVFGWMMLGTDILNMLISWGRLNFVGMGGKRSWCHQNRHNPFNKTAQWFRKERIRNYKPGIADLLQVAQTTDQFTGVGLSLGPIVGTIFDAAFGAYRYLNGERVKIAYDVPDMFEYEKAAGRGLAAAGLINSAGQVFSEETHFWSFVMGAASARLYTPVAHDFDIAGSVEDPMNIMVPAAEPTDPLTIEVIEEAGLNVQDGIGWPYNGKKEIALGDLWDELVPRNTQVFRDYCFRHSKDWYGYVVASMWDQVLPSTIFAFDPSGSVEYDDTPEMKTAFRMLKAPLLPTEQLTDSQAIAFMDWIKGYNEFYKKTPGLMAIKEKFDSLGIKYREAYPTEREPEADALWPKDFPISDYNLA